MRTLSFLGAGRYGSFWLRLTRPEWFAILVPLVIAGVLGVHRLAQPDALNGVLGYAGWGYDDGVHLGVSLRLTNGALPYRDYVFLHPPGLTVVFAPLAVLARLTSGTDALAVGRVLIALIGLANVVLVGLLARRRGPLAMLLGGMALAVWPLAPDALRTLMVEPIVVLLVLTGAMLLFPDQKSATPKQVFWAGALFGIALSLRLLAILPILAALVVVIWLMRQSLKRFVVGLVTSLAITVLPFFLLAPSQFIQQVFVTQLSRPTSNAATTSAGSRIAMVLGISTSPSSTQSTVAIVILLMFGLVVVGAFVVRRTSTGPLDWFALSGSVLTVLGVLRAPEAFWHYMYVSVAFLALLLALTAGLLVDVLPVHRSQGGISWRWVSGFVISAIVVLGGVGLLSHDFEIAESFPGDTDTPADWVRGLVPVGSCVATDVSTVLVVSDRFLSSDRNCPDSVDRFGSWLAAGAPGPGSQAIAPPDELVAEWMSEIEKIDYVVMSADYSNFFPWTTETKAAFSENFRKVGSRGRLVIYERV